MTLNLEKLERDDANHIDICQDKFGNLVSGVIPELAETYAAQIDIPAREYEAAIGGSWYQVYGAGVFALRLNYIRFYSNTNIGFRAAFF